MSELVQIGGHPQGLGHTIRNDAWWLGPLVTFVVFSGFVVYATWRVFEGSYYYAAPYLSPFYSPPLFIDPSAPGSAPLGHAWFGQWPSWWPHLRLLPVSPALLVLLGPLSFRFTCYYYRKAYYRAFAASPPGCAVVPVKQEPYKGETGLLLIQNLHRYALYVALAFVVILTYDGIVAFFREGRFGVGVGSIILLINPILIALYTFGCHSFRHLVGGRLDCYSCDGLSSLRHGLWQRVSWLNARHMAFAWASLIWVAFTDFYVRLVASGAIHDLNTWG